MTSKAGILVCLAGLFIFSVSPAQNMAVPMVGHGTGLSIGDHLLLKGVEKGAYGRTLLDVEGSPYLNETFVAGNVYSYKGYWTGVQMQYNIYDDLIEFKQDKKVYLLDPVPAIRKITLGDYTFVVEKHEAKGSLKSGFYILLDSGKVTLLSKKVVQFKEQQEPKALESAITPAKYIRAQDVYFYKIGAGEVFKVGSIKSLISEFPGKQEELKRFVKFEKISRNEEDLIKLVKYYNSL